MKCPAALDTVGHFKLAKLLRSEIVSSKQLNSVLAHRAKLYSPQLPAGNLAGVSQFSLGRKFSSPKANIAEKTVIVSQSRSFHGCGGRTRTYDLRVMSPTSYQLLYSAIWGARLVLVYNTMAGVLCQDPIFVISRRTGWFIGRFSWYAHPIRKPPKEKALDKYLNKY